MQVVVKAGGFGSRSIRASVVHTRKGVWVAAAPLVRQDCEGLVVEPAGVKQSKKEIEIQNPEFVKRKVFVIESQKNRRTIAVNSHQRASEDSSVVAQRQTIQELSQGRRGVRRLLDVRAAVGNDAGSWGREGSASSGGRRRQRGRLAMLRWHLSYIFVNALACSTFRQLGPTVSAFHCRIHPEVDVLQTNDINIFMRSWYRW